VLRKDARKAIGGAYFGSIICHEAVGDGAISSEDGKPLGGIDFGTHSEDARRFWIALYRSQSLLQCARVLCCR